MKDEPVSDDDDANMQEEDAQMVSAVQTSQPIPELPVLSKSNRFCFVLLFSWQRRVRRFHANHPCFRLVTLCIKSRFAFNG